jgi:hypothetical protein
MSPYTFLKEGLDGTHGTLLVSAGTTLEGRSRMGNTDLAPGGER